MSRLVYLLVVSSTLLLLAQARQDEHHGKPPAKYQSNNFVPEKKDWSKISKANQQKWKNMYQQSNLEKRVPWIKVSDDMKATFAHSKIRQTLANKRRAVKKKLISEGKYDPKEGRLVFKNPADLIAWTIQDYDKPQENKEKKEKKEKEGNKEERNQKVLPGMNKLTDKLKKLKDQLAAANKKKAADKKNAPKSLIQEVLSSPGKIIGQAAEGIDKVISTPSKLIGQAAEGIDEVISTPAKLIGQAGDEIGKVIREIEETEKRVLEGVLEFARSASNGNAADEGGSGDILNDIVVQLFSTLTSLKSNLEGFISKDEAERSPKGGPTDRVVAILKTLAAEIKNSLEMLKKNIDDYVGVISFIPVVGDALAPLTRIFQEVSDILAFVILTLDDFIDED